MKYAIYKIHPRKASEVVEVFSGKYDACIALDKLCSSLGGDYEMWVPVELWKVNKYFCIYKGDVTNTKYCVDTYPRMTRFRQG